MLKSGVAVFLPLLFISTCLTFMFIFSPKTIEYEYKESNYKNLKDNNILFLISHDNSNTGAPIVLYNLFKFFIKKNYRSKLVVLHNTTGENSIMQDYVVKKSYQSLIDYALDECVDWSTDNQSKDYQVEQRKGVIYKCKPIILVNSIINFDLIEYLVTNNYEFDIYFIIHEWLDETSAAGFPFKVEILQSDRVKKIVLPCQKAIENWNFNTGKEVAIKYTYTSEELQKKFTQYPYFNITSTYGIDKDSIVISMIGTVDRRKSQVEFIKNVFVRILKEEKNVKLFLVGRVIHHFPEVLELLLDTQVIYYGKIFIIGEVQNPLSIISQSDIILSYSKNEVMPLNIIESMFLSKPVVSSNAGCCSELITKNDNGFIFYNESEVERVLLSLIRNKDERKRLGDNGHKKFLLDHSERNYELYFDFFK